MMCASNRIINPKWFCDCVYRDEINVNRYFYGFREHFAKKIAYDITLSVLEYNYDWNFIKRKNKNHSNPEFILLNKHSDDTDFRDSMNNAKVSFHTYEMTCNYLIKGKMSFINYGDFKNKIKRLFDKYCDKIKYTV